MEKPDFRDAVYESFFSGGYTSAAASGALDKGLYDKHKAFFRSMDQGAPLVAWCHFVDTYFGDRDKLIDNLDDNNLAPVVRLLFYVRNAFVHCAGTYRSSIARISGRKFANSMNRVGHMLRFQHLS